MNPPILEMKNITKEFPGVKALGNVNLQLFEGEIHALVGENGAGKSTLMKILSGVYPFGSFEGSVIINSVPQEFKHIRMAQKSGINIIHQELNLVQDISVGENIFLGREPVKSGSLLIDWVLLHEQSKAVLGVLGVSINSKDKVRDLSVGEQQLVEIAKALSQESKILILDEPTSALSETESERLFNILRSLKQKNVTMVYISHKLNEVFSISERVTVLRDGKTVETMMTKDATQKRIISLMVGRELQQLFPQAERHTAGEVMKVENFSVDHPFLPGEQIVANVSFKVHKGEILGIAGLMGSGRSELVTGLFGAFPEKTSGRISIDGADVKIKSPRHAIQLGLALATEDRKLFGLVLGMSVTHNLSLAALDLISRGPLVVEEKENQIVEQYVGEMQIKTAGLDLPVLNLSGGNQQKIVLAKWLALSPKVLFLDEPTRGIDVGAKYEIYQLMNRLTEKGIGIVMISSDLPEVLGMSDRILVMREGTIVKELDGRTANAEEVMRYAAVRETVQV